MPEEIFLEKPLAIIGEEDTVLGFSALGFKTYTPQDPQAFKTILDELVRNKIAVCLVADDIYLARQEEIDSYKEVAFPIFIPFSKTAKTDLVDNIIKEIRLKATGTF